MMVCTFSSDMTETWPRHDLGLVQHHPDHVDRYKRSRLALCLPTEKTNRSKTRRKFELLDIFPTSRDNNSGVMTSLTQDCGVDGKMKIFQPETERFYSKFKTFPVIDNNFWR